MEASLELVLHNALAGTCASWVAAEAAHASALLLLETQHSLDDAQFRLRLAAGLVIATLQHLLLLPL